MLSIVIPTLNEERVIGRTLDALQSQPGSFEVVVSDGGSVDGTVHEIARRPAVVWTEGIPGRAAQLDRGVEAARGEMLLFLHADTILPAAAIPELNVLERSGDRVAGGFPHRFEGGGCLVRLASWVHSTRSRLTGIYYGDQAPFVSRRLFEEIGGFGDVAVMEDLDLGRRVRRTVRPIRMGNPVLNSPRKLVQRGVVRSTLDALYLLACFELGRTEHLGGHPFFRPFR